MKPVFPKTIKIQNEDWCAYVAPSFGMSMLSLEHRGRELLRCPESREAFLAQPEAFGTPPLLPAGRTRNAAFEFRGIRYQLTVNEEKTHSHKHGYLHRSSFSVTGQGESYITGCFENPGEIYPFPFRAEISCELKEDACCQSFCFTNTGERTMPVIFAVHQAFAEPEYTMIPIDGVWELDAEKIPSGRLLPVTKQLDPFINGSPLSHQPVDAVCRSAGSIALIGPYSFEVSEGFTQWVIWNKTGDLGFLCVEPMSAPGNAFEQPELLRCIDPGESYTFQTRIRAAQGGMIKRSGYLSAF